MKYIEVPGDCKAISPVACSSRAYSRDFAGEKSSSGRLVGLHVKRWAGTFSRMVPLTRSINRRGRGDLACSGFPEYREGPR
jgi:hypothetical protein